VFKACFDERLVVTGYQGLTSDCFCMPLQPQPTGSAPWGHRHNPHQVMHSLDITSQYH
jgi:hypothetical protein